MLVNSGCYATEVVGMDKEEVFTEVSSYCFDGCSVHLVSFPRPHDSSVTMSVAF